MSKLHPKAIYLFWWSYLWVWFFFIGIIFGVIGGFWITGLLGILNSSNYIAIISNIIIFSFVASLILGGVWAKLMYNSYSYETSTKSLNIRWGVIRKHSVSIPYYRIQNIDIYRGIIARIVGLSEVWVQTAGMSAGFGKYGTLRFSEGLIPGLKEKEAEKLKQSLLKKVRGRQGL